MSYESSVDVHDFGMILPDSSIQEIRNAVRRVSDLPASQLEQMARGAWEYARANHTREKFAQEYSKCHWTYHRNCSWRAAGAERLAGGTTAHVVNART